MVIVEYAVRVKGTQMYLPRPQRRDGRGGSHLEPMDFSRPEDFPKDYRKNMQIRTFREERAARIFLSSWLKGRFYGDEDGYVWIGKNSQRNREDMEIVPLQIKLPD